MSGTIDSLAEQSVVTTGVVVPGAKTDAPDTAGIDAERRAAKLVMTSNLDSFLRRWRD